MLFFGDSFSLAPRGRGKFGMKIWPTYSGLGRRFDVFRWAEKRRSKCQREICHKSGKGVGKIVSDVVSIGLK